MKQDTSQVGEPLAGKPLAGEPLAGEPLAGEPLAGATRTSAPPTHIASDTQRLRLYRPSINDAKLGRAMARCLSEAFSSGLWQKTPMPLGAAHDPHSAHGILSGLGPEATALAAAPDPGNRVVGCVVGCVMQPSTIEGYHLGDFGAQPGDGLLAFIGITPSAQGRRFRQAGDGWLMAQKGAPSLARHLFCGWLAAPGLRNCPRLFIRTRPSIGAIRRLSEDYDFALCGEFETEFRGQRQTRLVYRRDNQRC